MTSIESLLAERDWLRRLCAQLLRDEHLAEDLAQETELSALRYAPKEARDLRAWLARVARNLAGHRQRRERLRARIEPLARHEESAPAAADVAERFDLHRSVVGEVAQLAEPYRTALLLRYWDELTPTEIAKQLGEPLETVRTRLRRARALLRGRLDARHGHRAAWLAPLAGLHGWTLPATASPWIWTGALLMSKKLAFAASLAVLAGLALWQGLQEPELDSPKDTPSLAASAQDEQGTAADVDLPGDRPAVAPARRAGAAAATLLITGGTSAAPVADARVRIWPDDVARPSELYTDERGRCDISGLLPAIVEVRAKGFVPQRKKLGEGTERRVELAMGARLRVLCTRPDGAPVSGVELGLVPQLQGTTPALIGQGPVRIIEKYRKDVEDYCRIDRSFLSALHGEENLERDACWDHQLMVRPSLVGLDPSYQGWTAWNKNDWIRTTDENGEVSWDGLTGDTGFSVLVLSPKRGRFVAVDEAEQPEVDPRIASFLPKRPSSWSQPLRLRVGEEATARFQVEGDLASLRGTALPPKLLEGITGQVTLQIAGPSSPLPLGDKSVAYASAKAPNGSFAFDRLPAGRYHVRFLWEAGQDIAFASRTVELGPGEDRDLGRITIDAVPSFELRFAFRSQDGSAWRMSFERSCRRWGSPSNSVAAPRRSR